MISLGAMAMPADFRYREVFLKGKPQHDRLDNFRIQHPQMELGRRAFIFSPFDALKGFKESIASKNVAFRCRVCLENDAKEEIDRRVNILHNLTYNKRMARKNRVIVTVTFFEVCRDQNNEAYGIRGLYRTITGICWKVDSEISHTIQIDRFVIGFDDILAIENTDGVFEKDWYEECVDYDD